MSTTPGQISQSSTHIRVRNNSETWERRVRRRIKSPEPDLRMFQDASDIEISGGNFTNNVAPRTTVQLNIYQVKPGQSLVASSICPQVPVVHGQRSTDNLGLNYDEELDTCPPSPLGLSSSSSYSESNLNSSPESNINGAPFTTLPVQQTIQEIYKTQLAHATYGTPLWIPSANLRSPLQYRMKGVTVADVGILTPEGGFDQLYNANLLADDPANCLRVPEIFTPLHPRLSAIDIREFREFSSRSHLASRLISVTSSKKSGHTSAMDFKSSASQGAVLIMPEGAYVEELNNLSRLQHYIANNAESIYCLLTNTLGRNVKNGELRIVYGCRKSTAFGLASFLEPPQGHTTQLRFCFGDEYDIAQGFNGEPAPNQWDYSGVGVAVKTGPESGENHGLETEDNTAPRNQTLFVSTLSVKLSDCAWHNLEAGRLGVLNSSIKGTFKNEAQNGLDRGANMSSLQPIGQQENHSTGGEQHSLSTVIDSLNFYRSLHHKETVDPHEILHSFLMEKAPEAKMSIVSERDCLPWWDTMNNNLEDQSIPVLINKVCILNNICEQDGTVYFEPRDPPPGSAEKDINEVAQSLASGNLTIEHYFLGSISNERHLNNLVDLIKDVQAFQFTLNESAIHFPTVYLPGYPKRPFSLDEIASGHIESASISELRNSVLNSWGQSTNTHDLVCMQSLANSLIRRYSYFEQSNDLHEAIWYYETLQPLLPKNHYRYLEVLLSLSSAFFQRLQLLQQTTDQERLVKCLEKQSQFKFSEISESFHNIVSFTRSRIYAGQPTLRNSVSITGNVEQILEESSHSDDRSDAFSDALSSTVFGGSCTSSDSGTLFSRHRNWRGDVQSHPSKHHDYWNSDIKSSELSSPYSFHTENYKEGYTRQGQGSPMPSMDSSNTSNNAATDEIKRLELRVVELERQIAHTRAMTHRHPKGFPENNSSEFTRQWKLRTNARIKTFCSLDQAGNALCTWHNSRRSQIHPYTPMNAPPGRLNCGCTYEEALFEDTLVRHHVCSSSPGVRAYMDPALRKPLLKLLQQHYNYKDGDFDYDPITKTWGPGESPEEWVQRALSI